MKRTLERKKNPRHPKKPASLAQFREDILKPSIMSQYGYNSDGDSRFYLDTVLTENFEFTIFYSQYVISFIRNNIPAGSRNYIIDGTFGSIPKNFYQLLIMTIEYKNDVSNSGFRYANGQIKDGRTHEYNMN